MRKIALALVVLVSAVSRADDKSAPAQILSAAGGRFVFGQISDLRRDQFLLDTKTGRLWLVVKDPKTERIALEPVMIVGTDGKESVEPK